MSMQNEFEVTEDDVLAVLRNNSLKVALSKGMSLELMAKNICDGLHDDELDGVVHAALAAGPDQKARAAAAHEELACLLVEKGVLEAPVPPSAPMSDFQSLPRGQRQPGKVLVTVLDSVDLVSSRVTSAIAAKASHKASKP